MTQPISPPELSDTVINTGQADQVQVNFYANVGPCNGVTLADLRVRLRNTLSNYAENTLISSDPTNDVEKQFINDGISMLWPHDYQIVMKSAQVVNGKRNRYILPDDCEHVFSVYKATTDINNDDTQLCPLPHGDMWRFDKSWVDAVSPTKLDGTPWVDQAYKALWVQGAGKMDWVVARYARKWAPLNDELQCIDPSPNRVLAITYYAAYEYFVSQMQVNTESIRYRNYQSISTQFFNYYQQLLIKDSKPLFIL